MFHNRLMPVFMLLIVCLCFQTAFCEPEETPVADAMAFFSGVYGHVAFQLPGTPELIKEQDYPGGWTGSRQLMGNCIGDGAEYQLHTADISPLEEYFRTNFPDDSEDQHRLQALMNYGMFIPNTYGIEIGDVKPHGERETGNLWVDMSFTYKDDPDTPYIGRFLLSGTQAVCLIIEKCDHTDAILNALQFVTDEEYDKLIGQKSQPTYRKLRGLEMTFPAPPIESQGDQSTEFLACFAADWSFIQVQFNPVGFILNVSDDELKDTLITIAQQRMLTAYETDEVLDPVVTRPVQHTARLSFSFVNHQTLGEYGQRMLGSLYVGEYGIWYVYAADTETGRAFMDSLRLEDEASGNAENQAVPSLNGASTLPAFRDALETLMAESTLGFPYKPGNFYWSEPVFSGGKWLRTVFSVTDSDPGAALISLDSSADDAAIREVRMLRYDWEENKDDWMVFGRLCSLALTGRDEIQPEHLASEGSDLVYDRIILTPAGSIPTLLEDIAFPEGQDIADITDNGVTTAILETRMNELADEIPFSYSGTYNGVRIYTFGDQTGIMVYTDEEKENAAITMIIVLGQDPASSPYVLYGTMTAYAAMTGMTQEEFASVSYVLMESPMWGQLADLWPLLCRGNICAHLQENGDENTYIPMGFISGRP